MRTRIAVPVTIGMLSVLVACSSSTAPTTLLSRELDYEVLGASAQCATGETVSTAGWQAPDKVGVPDGAGFRFLVPPDFERAQVQGIDSYVGRWASSTLRFATYDYGWYSSSLHQAKEVLAGYSACRDIIDGQPVALLFGWDSTGTFALTEVSESEGTYQYDDRWYDVRPKYIVAATWRNVKPKGEPATHLTMITASDQALDRPTLLTILRSVQFTP